MTNIFKTLIITIILLSSQNLKAEEKIEEIKTKESLVVGYYGRPNTKSLGVLGQTNLKTLVQKMREKEEYFNKELQGKVDVQMAFHIIYGLATPDAGRRNTYMLRLSHKSIMKYIKRAQKEGFKVIIDLQMGANSPKEALNLVLKYLKYDDVHLALDPEFKIPKHRRYAPGRFIGHIYAKELNEAQELMSNYLKEHKLGKRELIVHMFTKRMLRKKEDVKKFDNIDLIYNVDGHGHPIAKIKIYNTLYKKEEKNIAKSGFKIFYKNDSYEMNPRQILGWEAIKGNQIWSKPYYINYQ